MDFIQPSIASQIFFLLIVLAVIVAAILGVYYSLRRDSDPALPRVVAFALGLAALIAVDSLVVGKGLLEPAILPRLPMYFALNMIACAAFALSPLGRNLAGALPLAALVGFQAFRLPLELVLHNWVESGTIPATMSWNGSNFDIITGISAILLAPLSNRFKPAAWAFNLIGSLLLLNVIRVVILSSPFPFAWPSTIGLQPPLLLALYLPFTWIAPVCVGGALAGHIVLTRALLMDRGQPRL